MRSLAETVLPLTSEPRPRAQDSTTAPGPGHFPPRNVSLLPSGDWLRIGHSGTEALPSLVEAAPGLRDWAFGARDTAVWVPRPREVPGR